MKFSFVDKEYAKLPPIFHTDNYDTCLLHDDEALYCSITYELEPLDRGNPSETWQLLDVSIVLQIRNKM